MLLHRERTQALMANRKLDGLIATSPENVLYASGLTSWTLTTFRDREVYAVVPRTGPLFLIVPIDTLDHIAERPVAVEHLSTYGTYHIERNPDAVLSGAEARLVELRESASHFPNAQDALQHALVQSGMWRGRIGLDERFLPPERWHRLCELLGPQRVVPAYSSFQTIRRVKTAAEIDRLEYAVQAVERGIAAAFAIAETGVTEAALEQAFRIAVAATGTDPGHFETTAGTRSAASFPASPSYHIQPNDIVRTDCGGRFLGYWADTGRTIALGEPPVRLERYYTALHAGIEAMLAAIRPGIAVDALYDIGMGTVRAAGIPHYRRHHVGHAIGLEMYESPLIAPAGNGEDRSAVLEEGMVINIELPYYELGRGGLQIEETLLVQGDGAHLLTKATRQFRTTIGEAS